MSNRQSIVIKILHLSVYSECILLELTEIFTNSLTVISYLLYHQFDIRVICQSCYAMRADQESN